MEYEFPGIIRVKVVVKNILLGDPTPSCFCNVMSLFEENTYFLNQTVTLKWFPC